MSKIVKANALACFITTVIGGVVYVVARWLSP
jgi:hypothetical protein